jgi:hypothetical protein
MASPRTIRLDGSLDKKVEEYTKQNRLKFSQLVKMAIEKFISQPQTIELVPVSDSEWLKTTKKAFKKHKHAMDKL